MALIHTTLGDLDESALTRTEGGHTNDTEVVSWVQYEFNGEVVRRDVHMALKQGVFGSADAASL